MIQYFPGVLLSLLFAAISFVISKTIGGPDMLYALLLGISANKLLTRYPSLCKGVSFSAKNLLKIGVCLLGAEISFADFQSLGEASLVWLYASVALTIVSGVVFAKMFGLSKEVGILTGGSVAICGSSAAMAISSVLPKDEQLSHNTIFTVVGVTVLSTVCMVLYPLIVKVLGIADVGAGFLLGGSIHNVGQVVGAGGIVSPEVQTFAVMFKLARIAILIFVVMSLSFFYGRASGQKLKFTQLVPLFLIGFAILVLLNSLSVINQEQAHIVSLVSKFFLLVAIAALGVQTHFRDLMRVGVKPILLLTCETTFLLLIILLGVYLIY